MGIVPANTKLAPKHKDIKDWETLSAEEKEAVFRQRKPYAGFAGAHRQRDRAVCMPRSRNLASSTNNLFIYIVGDNGASCRGSNEWLFQ
jgi:arylsulfatase